MKKSVLYVGIPLLALLLGSCNFLMPKKKSSNDTSNPTSTTMVDPDNPDQEEDVNPDVDPAEPIIDEDPAEPADPEDVTDYYAKITDSMSGQTLLEELYAIIHPKKCPTAYGAVWDYLIYCDAAHPERTGSPDGDIMAFYRGDVGSRSAMNKEHVWPNSRGGNYVEGDPHMTRPTFTKDNSDRGNSFYVEGMNHNANGWDPKTAGMTESYRGDSARIILYAAVQEKTKLKLVDLTNDSTGNCSMGKLSDLLKWNIEYPPQQREMNRNDILNGKMTSYGKTFDFNRNPFIDHPEYACRIWGSTNSTTRAICGM